MPLFGINPYRCALFGVGGQFRFHFDAAEPLLKVVDRGEAAADVGFSHAGAPQGGEVCAAAERDADVAGKGADLCTLGAADAQVDFIVGKVAAREFYAIDA